MSAVCPLNFELVHDAVRDDWTLHNRTWNRSPWRGSIDCPLWGFLTSRQRAEVAARRLRDAQAVRRPRASKSDRDSYGLMLKRMRADLYVPASTQRGAAASAKGTATMKATVKAAASIKAPTTADLSMVELRKAHLIIVGAKLKATAGRVVALKAIEKALKLGKGVSPAAAIFLALKGGDWRGTDAKAKPATAPKSATPAARATVSDDIAAQRSDAARKAWATRRAQGWSHPNAIPAPAPLKRANLKQYARA